MSEIKGGLTPLFLTQSINIMGIELYLRLSVCHFFI
jgi:hypothetical protein